MDPDSSRSILDRPVPWPNRRGPTWNGLLAGLFFFVGIPTLVAAPLLIKPLYRWLHRWAAATLPAELNAVLMWISALLMFGFVIAWFANMDSWREARPWGYLAVAGFFLLGTWVFAPS
jgi:hypothetical protein